jgi:hypothetical protein
MPINLPLLPWSTRIDHIAPSLPGGALALCL